jgi:hypothetical protein
MRVSPFVYFNQQEIETVIPFPTLNGSVWEVWETDSGLTLSGSSVTAWVGNQNSRTLNYVSAIPPTVSSSNANFNSYDSVVFDRTSNSRMIITGSDIQGVNTGSLHFCVYAITKDTAASNEGQFGMGPFSSPFNFLEAYLFANTSTRQQIYRFQPTAGGFIESDDDTYGKGIYTISQGTGTNGGKYFNKGTTENALWTITNYVTTRVSLQLGSYDSTTTFAGSIDVVAAVVWTNSTNLTADITSLQNYFQTKYGT